MRDRLLKDQLYAQVARIGKAVASPKRLELIEVLAQGEKGVEALAADTGIDVRLASVHLKELRAARLVENRRDGRSVIYRLAGDEVAQLWVVLRTLAEDRLLELRSVMQELVAHPDELSPVGGKELLAQARRGAVIVIDVRPESEYRSAHLPHARSMPLAELETRLGELPTDKPVVAYCRGPFCLMAREAVRLLNRAGIPARRLDEGVAEWRARGLQTTSTRR